MSGTFHGLPVHNVLTCLESGHRLPSAEAAAWRISLGYGHKEGFAQAWQRFLDGVDPSRVRALVLGPWWSGEYDGLAGPLAAITASAARLPALEALFLGDAESEDCEISWLQMCDITPALDAFPGWSGWWCAAGTGWSCGPSGTGGSGRSPSSPAGCPPRWCAPSARATCPP
ncbi:hypothetical protein GCM10025734_54080 [Kitasatospora paranensis]